MYEKKSNQSLKFDAFRQNLIALMETKRIRRSDIADAIGCQRGTITRYLTQDRDPDIEFAYRIAQYFNVSLDWLLGLSESKYSSRYSPEAKHIMELYTMAETNDQIVIQTILSKYEKDANK